MSDPRPANINQRPNAQPVGDLFDPKKGIASTRTSELVIALCGPIGSPIHKVAETIKESLLTDFGYEVCQIIRLSKIIQEHTEEVTVTSQYERIKKLIALGDQMRGAYGSTVLAELAISKIAIERERARSTAGDDRHQPRRVCHILDSIKNQEELDILKSVYGDMLYFFGVFSPLPARVKSLERQGMTAPQIYDLIDQDSGEEFAHGQTVRNTFPEADFFLRIEHDTDTPIKARVERFLHIILGTKLVTPANTETAMYLAASAGGNSACLSRQVGAALTDQDGEVISIGWNDVPKAGGNLYTSDPAGDPNAEKDKRCWNLEGGVCFNDREKKMIAELLVEGLEQEKVIQKKDVSRAVSYIVTKSKVKDLIEFSRSIHAEMHAILLGSQTAGSRIRDGKLFTTTYPCHSCCRHIIAAGIKEVYYIEPYRKSLGTKLHDDAITEDEGETGKVRILPFDGVAPTRYLKFFNAPKSSRKIDGMMARVDQRSALPRFENKLEAFHTLEGLVVRGLQERSLLPVEQ